MKEGDRVKWMTANGIRYGILVARCDLGWLVRLDNDKCIIADTNSLIPL